jgi:hypothetical protein
VFAPEDARRLGAIRIGLCCLLALRLATANFGSVAGQPETLFEPRFYMHLFEGMPSQEAATALQIGGATAALLAAAGLGLRLTLPAAVACSLVLNGMLNSAGRVIVGDAVLTLCLLVLVAAGGAAGEGWSLRGRRTGTSVRYGWPVRTAMVVVVLAYFFAGLQKWRFSGPSWVTSSNLRLILIDQAHPGRLALFVADRPALVHVVAAGTLLLETCFPLVLFVPRLRWLLIPGAVAMHVAIRIALGLDYSAQWLTLVIVFVNWPVLVGTLRRAVRVPALRGVAG